MRLKKFEEKIKARIRVLTEENKHLINIGDKDKYQCNCNQLKGINFVYSLFKQMPIEEEHFDQSYKNLLRGAVKNVKK